MSGKAESETDHDAKREAIKGTPGQYAGVIRTLRERGIAHDIHGDEKRGPVYFRDPDGILLEVTTGY